MDTMKICPGCQKPLARNAPDGLCPECLAKAALPTGADIGPDSEMASRSVAFAAPSVEDVARLFPQLEILEFIGQGGMGAVYQARQKDLDRVVALKILPPNIGRDASFAERFTREARALARLNHPGIVTLYEFGRADGLFFFLMEFVDGVNLHQLLDRGRLSSRQALAIVPQICDALQYAHDQGIVHRDIKPENILLDRQGRVKVADFGLAKLVGPGEENPPGALASAVTVSVLTEAGKMMGTPHYMAPEQREHPTEVDHRADIYSLGVVFYRMLTGELPGQPIAPPSSRTRGMRLDVRLDEVVLKALESEPERRYQQASQLKTVIETITGNPPPEHDPVRRPETASRPSRTVVAGLRKAVGIGFILLAMVWSILFPKTREIFRPDFVASVAIGLGLLCGGIGILILRRRNAWRVAFSVALVVILLLSVFFLSLAAQGRRALHQLQTEGWQPVPLPKPISSPSDPATASSIFVSQAPELRFLAWQGQDMQQHDREIDQAWHPDGSPIDVKGMERRLLGEVNRTFIGDRTQPGQRYLYLWLSHPSFDSESRSQVQVMDNAGRILETGITGHASQAPSSSNDDLGWLICSFRLKEEADWAKLSALRVRYSLGSWKEGPSVPADYTGWMALPCGVRLASVGQDAQGHAFVAITRDMKQDPDTQIAFAVRTHDGRRGICHSRGSTSEGDSLHESFAVDMPLTQLKEFRMLTRPMREVEFKQVVVKPDPFAPPR